MIDAIPEVLHLHLDGMNLAIESGRSKCQAVFVANELRDFRVSARKFLIVFREVDAASRGERKLAERLIRLGEALFQENAVSPGFRRKLFDLGWFANFARE